MRQKVTYMRRGGGEACFQFRVFGLEINFAPVKRVRLKISHVPISNAG
ncbi:TPA: hypothetical protein HA238_04605 [Candidatus Micrarchaeota archaeon]|nr:hypothetical protein [Candidatus Micrarchaeota archaeon]